MRDIKIRTASIQDLPAILEIYSYYILHTAITFEYDVPTPEEFRLRANDLRARGPELAGRHTKKDAKRDKENQRYERY